MPITARHKMTIIENREWNTSADAKLTAVSMRGNAVCQTRSPVWSDRFPHQIMITEARANGIEEAGLHVREPVRFDNLRLPDLQAAADRGASRQNNAERQDMLIAEHS